MSEWNLALSIYVSNVNIIWTNKCSLETEPINISMQMKRIVCMLLLITNSFIEAMFSKNLSMNLYIMNKYIFSHLYNPLQCKASYKTYLRLQFYFKKFQGYSLKKQFILIPLPLDQVYLWSFQSSTTYSVMNTKLEVQCYYLHNVYREHNIHKNSFHEVFIRFMSIPSLLGEWMCTWLGGRQKRTWGGMSGRTVVRI